MESGEYEERFSLFSKLGGSMYIQYGNEIYIYKYIFNLLFFSNF